MDSKRDRICVSSQEYDAHSSLLLPGPQSAPLPSPAQTWGLQHPKPRSPGSGHSFDLPYSMAAPKGVAQGTDRRTTWPPTGSTPHALPPGHRKFPFESQAADRVAGAAVTAEQLLNQSDEGCE